jgi:uncharacterized alkaline shock family protein YloU
MSNRSESRGEPRAAGRPVYGVEPDDDLEQESELGSIHIHNTVIAAIARQAALKVPGVSGMVGTLADGLAGIVGRKTSDKGVVVEIVDDGVVLELNVEMQVGVYIPKVAWQAQQDVREAVERMTGKSVKSVNVIVRAIRVPADEPAAGRDERRPT